MGAFNERVAVAHGAAWGALQRLKARWRILQRRTEPKLPDLHNMIGACCVLHNFCERRGEGLDVDLQSGLSWDKADVLAVLKAGKERDRIVHK